MTIETKSIVFNAIPLFAIAAMYGAVAASVSPPFWRGRRQAAMSDLVLAAMFACVAGAAVLLGVLVVIRGEPLESHLWLSFGATLVALLPGIALFARRPLLDPERLRESEERRSELDRELASVKTLSAGLVGAATPAEVALTLIKGATSALRVDVGGLWLVNEEETEAEGVLLQVRDVDAEWFRGKRLNLRDEPSGAASAVFEAAPFAIYDASASPLVGRELVERGGAKSVAFFPLLSEGKVIAVLVLAARDGPRAFSTEELALGQALANEAALALDRLRSSAALRESLDRERLVSRISMRFRTELDVDNVLRVAVEETGRALGVSRCFVRLGDPGVIEAEWHLDSLDAIGDHARAFPGSNLAARERRTVAIDDIDKAPELTDASLGSLEALRSVQTRALLATPVLVFDQMIGVFALHRTEPRPWTAGEIAVAESVAHEVGVALHIARLLAVNEERLRQQTALLRSAQQVAGELELETVLQRLVDEVAGLLAVEAADLYLLEQGRGIVRCAAVHGLPSDLVGFEFPADRGVAAEAIRRGVPVVSAEYEHIAAPVPHQAYAGFAEAIVAPMRWSGETRGVLGVGTRGDRKFTEIDADVLGAFASLASLALRNAETFEERSRQARVQRGFYRIASILGRSLSLPETLDAAAQAASEVLGGSFAAVLVPTREKHLELAGGHDLPATLADALRDGLPESASVLALCSGERRVIAAASLSDDDRFDAAWKELARSAGTDALLAVPLETSRSDDRCGLIVIFFGEARRFTDDDLDLARQVADAARGALERAQLFEAERSARALAQELSRAGSMLATELDPDAVLDEVVRRAPELLGADACAVRMIDGTDLVVTDAFGDGAASSIGTQSPTSGWLSGDVFQSRSAIAVANAAEDPRYLEADPILQAGYGAYLGVPLVGPEGALHGVLSLYARRPRAWRDDEIAAVNALATSTSAALSNAELYTSVAMDRERSYAILANIADGIVAVDRDGDVVLWNAAAERITGVPATEAVGRAIPDVLGRNLEGDGAAQAERLLSIAHGAEEVWLSVTEAVMRDPGGAVAGRIFAFRDISADRLVEEMKSEFVATVSHELRGPLTSIYGFAETLLRDDVNFSDDERRTFLGYVASEAARLTTIVDALLNVARLDTGDLHVDLRPTDVGTVVSEVLDAVAEPETNGHRFVLDLPDEPLAAQADRDKLRQILAALVDNAVKFSPSGGTVTVGARRAADRVEVHVEDQGVGIPYSEQEWIFRKFYRGGDTAHGTGLGLFIARGLVSAMGGRISVKSEEGKGSRFWFELPAAAVVQEDRPRV